MVGTIGPLPTVTTLILSEIRCQLFKSAATSDQFNGMLGQYLSLLPNLKRLDVKDWQMVRFSFQLLARTSIRELVFTSRYNELLPFLSSNLVMIAQHTTVRPDSYRPRRSIHDPHTPLLQHVHDRA